MNALNEIYLLSKFDASSCYMTGYIDFQTRHFIASEQFKIDRDIPHFRQVKTDSYGLFY